MGLSREQAKDAISRGCLDLLKTNEWKYDDDLQVHAIKLNPDNIKYIMHPCLKVKQMLKKMEEAKKNV